MYIYYVVNVTHCIASLLGSTHKNEQVLFRNLRVTSTPHVLLHRRKPFQVWDPFRLWNGLTGLLFQLPRITMPRTFVTVDLRPHEAAWAAAAVCCSETQSQSCSTGQSCELKQLKHV